MKLNFLVDVDMEDFIKKGKFDCVQIGQSKELILNNFPDPDGNFSMLYKDSIWKYGAFEFHFADNCLHLIFCEDLSLNIGNNIKLNKWIFDKPPFTLTKIIKLLNDERINYNIRYDSTDVKILIVSSNIKLYFDCRETKDFNKCRLSSISLSG